MTEFYVVECNSFYGSGRQNYIAERSMETADFSNIVADILSGELENVSAVYRIDPEAGVAVNATADVAQGIVDRIVDGLEDKPSFKLIEFLEHALGCWTVADILRDLEDGRSDRQEHCTYRSSEVV